MTERGVAGSASPERPYQRMRDASFPEAYRRLVPPVRSRCRRILRDASAAEDVVQETFLRLWRVGPTVDDAGIATVVRWLRKTSTRLSIDALREGRRGAAALRGLDRPLGCSDDALEARDTLSALSENVPSRELEAVLLCRVDGHRHPEAAEIMGVSERTVRRLLGRFDKRPRLDSLVLGLVLALAAVLASRSCSAAELDAPANAGAP